MGVKKILKNSKCVREVELFVRKKQIKKIGEEAWVKKIYEKEMGVPLDLNNPKTLNEKTVWLKVNYLQDFYLKSCDKYMIHKYLEERLGKDYAPRLLFVTQNPKELSLNKISKFPCIIKVSNGSGANLIVKNSKQFSDNYLQKFFEKQIIVSNIHTIVSREHQYLEKNPYIVVEELLQDDNGNIPNDYKFLYINGELQFIYCSVDREGANVRHVYDKDWNRLDFIWVKGADKEMYEKFKSSPSIPRPHNFKKMIELSQELAKDFPLVRIDFYETCENLYIGEITLHHGSGSDRFYPAQYDLYYGEKLVLPKANR